MGILLIKKLKLLGLLITQLLNPNSQFFGQNQNRPSGPAGIFQNQNQNGPIQDPYPVNPDFEPLFPPLDFFVNVSTTTTRVPTTSHSQFPRPTTTPSQFSTTRPTATPPQFPTTSKTTTEIIFITSKLPASVSSPETPADEQLIDEVVIIPDLNPTNKPAGFVDEDSTTEQQVIDPENILVDPETGRKFEKNTKGPCGDNMIFYTNPVNQSSKYGVCDCEDQMSKEPKRPLLFLFGQEKCFPFFTQGPCSPTHWLVLNDQNLPVCKKNPCLNLNNDRGDDDGFYFARGNSSECLKTKTKGDCQDGQVLDSISSSWLPTCVNSEDQEIEDTTSSNENFKCRPGSRLYRMNLCY